MRRLCLPLILFLVGSSHGAESVHSLTAELWSSPRQGDNVTRMSPVAAAVAELIQREHSELVLRHPGGEEGVLWVQELRAWLVSLGIESERIALEPGSPRSDVIELYVRSETDRHR